jgi:hypothetical protein
MRIHQTIVGQSIYQDFPILQQQKWDCPSVHGYMQRQVYYCAEYSVIDLLRLPQQGI